MPRAQLRKGREEHRLVGRPGAARHEGERRIGDGEQRVGPVDGGHHAEDGVDARIAGHLDRLGRRAELRHPGAVRGRDRPDRVEDFVAAAGRHEGGPAQPTAHRGDGRRDHGDVRAARRGARGEFRPEVELGEDQQVGSDGLEDRVDIAGEVVGEIAGAINRQRGREALRRGREMGVEQLQVGAAAAERLEDRLGLQSLADGWGVEPGQRSGSITMEPSPGHQGGRGGPTRSVGPLLPVVPEQHRHQRHGGAHQRAVGRGGGGHGGTMPGEGSRGKRRRPFRP